MREDRLCINANVTHAHALTHTHRVIHAFSEGKEASLSWSKSEFSHGCDIAGRKLTRGQRAWLEFKK